MLLPHITRKLSLKKCTKHFVLLLEMSIFRSWIHKTDLVVISVHNEISNYQRHKTVPENKENNNCHASFVFLETYFLSCITSHTQGEMKSVNPWFLFLCRYFPDECSQSGNRAESIQESFDHVFQLKQNTQDMLIWKKNKI